MPSQALQLPNNEAEAHFSLIICQVHPSLQDKMVCQGELAAHFQRHLPSSRSSVAACSDPLHDRHEALGTVCPTCTGCRPLALLCEVTQQMMLLHHGVPCQALPKIMLCQKAVVHQEDLNGTLELLLHAGAPDPCRSVAQIIDKLHGFACLVSVFSSIRASELLCKRNLCNSVAGYYVQF